MKKVLLAVLLVSGYWVIALLCLLDAEQQNPAFASKGEVNVLATVDGHAITKDDLYLAIVQSYPQQANETLNRLVNQILISKEAERRGVKVSDNELKKRADELGITGELSSVVKRIIERAGTGAFETDFCSG